MHLTTTTDPGPPVVGLVVSKAVGNAVVRNRVKRRLRALVRPRLDSLDAGTLVVVRAQSAASTATSDQLARDLDGGLGRARDRAARRATGHGR
ncbi:ribonuclease P protein component [Cellulomonas oligotrophica]|uniref:Ribonuclease P protein component n=1 Tax=Cellulomonas oligotrophica TaxID=931536 RepID=A0A7Y9FFY1_9CELL|nr:ribonuclease P protein component [Cellulomonas oligotrophica]